MAATIPDLIEMARKAGLDAVADRLDYLYELSVDDDGGGDDPMSPESTKLLASFMIEHPEMATDGITMGPSGNLDVMWDIAKYSHLVVEFTSSGNTRFSYIVDDPDSVRFNVVKRGEVSPNDMLKAIIPLIKHPA